jgi:hypothetical protein
VTSVSFAVGVGRAAVDTRATAYFYCAIVVELKLEHLICIVSQECITIELFIFSVPRLFVFSCMHREINGGDVGRDEWRGEGIAKL